MSGSRPGFRPSGVGVALLAFSVTRLLVAQTATTEAGTFVAASLFPLSAGLGLTLFGIAISVGGVSRGYARSVWRWTVLGTFAMLLVVVASGLHVILLGDRLGALWSDSGVLVANVLLGGAILGAFVGDRSARHWNTNERLVQYAERSMLVNRLLRHEIRNVLAIVNGYVATSDNDQEETTRAIRESTEEIEQTIEHAGEFAATTGEIFAVEIGDAIESVLDVLPEDADVSVAGSIPDGVLVRADDRLDLLVAELLENALQHAGPDPSVDLDVEVGHRTVELTVTDDGPGLPEPAESVLASRSLPEYDDPSLGYGLQMVRLLVEQYDGAIEADYADGTALTVTLQRTRERSTPALARGVPTVDLHRAGFAAVAAGIVMGLFVDQVAGLMPVVGSLYGVSSPVLGWVAHIFHSVLFGILFAAGCMLPRIREVAASQRGLFALGIGWGLLLWVFAAGIVMPIWLLAVGTSATIPHFSAIDLVAHVLWGAILGGLYARLPAETLLPT
ncbi:histidine kinase [Salinarchaeum sp. Harcht-Bsk1]|uniref:ATP-binding protein n=1 Tax=Salinarchaeum sp. Harcht-Bsk1 TaxID=1333523 RepID=UPI00034234F5|nr:ATP-binding protein [Salinarchaeum sp. Harcht-Bsk1]AGN00055.1 histidine kinase [Salinarchaeum sp. Harcht-Bsk1]